MITNKHNLPEPLVRAVKNDQYNAGDTDISATGMLQPFQMFALKREMDELTEDAADRIWALFGTAVHAILERVEDAGVVVEERYFAQVEGWKISGQIDVYDPSTQVLSDYKVTSVWAAKEIKPEWEAQLNIGKWLMEQDTFWRADKLEIVAILRDWNGSGHKRNPDIYPEVPVKVLDVPVWDADATEAFIKARVKGFQKALTGDYPPCTDEERWATPLTYAVHRKGYKRATRLFSSETDPTPYKSAEQFAEATTVKTGYKYEILERPREFKRCEKYCPVSDICRQNNANNI